MPAINPVNIKMTLINPIDVHFKKRMSDAPGASRNCEFKTGDRHEFSMFDVTRIWELEAAQQVIFPKIRFQFIKAEVMPGPVLS
ncbi:MAG: hypothetical protein WBO55_07510 [Rhizobiaceae bacterium]